MSVAVRNGVRVVYNAADARRMVAGGVDSGGRVVHVSGGTMKRMWGGSHPGQMRDLDVESKVPVWATDLIAEVRGMGDLMRTREALAVAHRDIERFRLERDRLLRKAAESQTKIRELEDLVVQMMKGKTDGR